MNEFSRSYLTGQCSYCTDCTYLPLIFALDISLMFDMHNIYVL